MGAESLSEQLANHQRNADDYELAKQVDQEATISARTDELRWLRSLEQQVQDLVRAHRDIRMKYSELSASLATLRSTVNGRLIAVLQDDNGKLE